MCIYIYTQKIHNTTVHHLLTNTQPAPKQRQLPISPHQLPLVIQFFHMVSHGRQCPFGCPGSIPSQLLVAPQPLTVQETEETETFLSAQHCSATTKALMRYQHYFSPEAETQHHTRLYKDITNSVPDETRTSNYMLRNH